MPRPALETPRYRLTRRPGKRHWEITWTEGGRSRYKSAGTEDESEAQEALAQYVEDLGQDAEPTLSRLLDQRWADLKNRGKGSANVRYLHNTAKRLIGHLQPADLTPSRVSKYMKDRAPHRTACTRELEEITAACHLAAENGIIAKAPKIKRPPKAPPRDRFLTKDQAQKLIAACESEHVKLFILLALTTGARRNAILDLTWDRVDLERGRVDFQDPEKVITKKRRTATPIDRRLVAVLQATKDMKRTDYVIEYRGKRVTNIRTGFRLTAERAKLPWCSPHVLKHTAISWLAEADISVEKIADMTATDPSTVRRIYRKFNPDYLAELSETLADHVIGEPALVSAQK